MLFCRLFFYCYGDHRDLHVLTHSFPTLRSSGLEVAFLSVRRLAQVAGVNPSAVIRLAQAAGFDSFDAFRRIFQAALQARKVRYRVRAEALQRDARRGQGGEQGTFQAVARSAIANIEAFFQPETAASLERIAKGDRKSTRLNSSH